MLSIYPLRSTFGLSLLPIIKGSLYSPITAHTSHHHLCKLITAHDIIRRSAQSASVDI